MKLPTFEILDIADRDAPHGHEHVVRSRWQKVRWWTWAHRLMAAGFLAVLIAGHHGMMTWFKGSITAATWFDLIRFVDPLTAAETAFASRQVTVPLLAGAATTMLMGLLLGRVFCGWLCPLGLLLEINESFRQFLRRHLKRHGVRPFERRLPTSIKYWVLAVCLGVSLITATPFFTSVSPINLMVLGAASSPLLLLAVVIPLAILEFFLPRAFCRSLCPVGAFYSLLGRWSPFRVWVVGTERPRCQRCTMQCPMGIDVMDSHVLAGHKSVDDPECTRCGTCTDVCLGETLQLRFGRPREAKDNKS